MLDKGDMSQMLRSRSRRAHGRRRRVTAAGGLSTIMLMLSLAGVPRTVEAVTPDPTHAFIGAITYGGSGCPQGSVDTSISNDREQFTFNFDNYFAKLGPGVPISENRQDCQLLVRIEAPVGFAFAVMHLDQRGFVNTDAGVIGRVWATAEVLDGHPGQAFAPAETTFAGPVSRDYLNSQAFGQVKWSACGGPSLLQITTAMALDNVSGAPGAQGLLTMDSLDGQLEQGVHIVWRKCNKGHDDGLATAFVQSLSYGGSGCPQGSVGQALNPSQDTFTLVFDQFVASTGPGIPVTEARKNCQLNVNVSAPAGWAWRLVGLDVDGFVRLPEGMEAQMKTTAFLGGNVGTAEDEFAGPLSDSYELTQDVMQGTSQWSSCDGGVTPLNLNTQIRITTPASGTSALATVDAIGGHIAWRQCGKP